METKEIIKKINARLLQMNDINLHHDLRQSITINVVSLLAKLVLPLYDKPEAKESDKPMKEESGSLDMRYFNTTENYLIRKFKSNSGFYNYDIEQKDLHYGTLGDTHHGVQCNHAGGTEAHKKITELCAQMVAIAKQIDELNNLPPQTAPEKTYYYPTIDEFYSGFEFESVQVISKQWVSDIFDISNFEYTDTLKKEIANKEIRVKCLDSEDIESFEYKKVTNHMWIDKDGSSDFKSLGITEYENEDGNILTIHPEGNVVILESRIGPRLFDGKIKNKSELKKILSQIKREWKTASQN